mgnify:CR=1 FL=1
MLYTKLDAKLDAPVAAALRVGYDGPGPNPLLQNHILMIIHPPMLYLGYVGMSVPFALACAGLLAGRLDAAWGRILRTWLLIPWGFLTVGIILGGWWSYEVLGWGGWWAWDPVENASFMPWLTATAAVHSVMLMRRRGHLKAWTIALVQASFLLTLLGTFMTRSDEIFAERALFRQIFPLCDSSNWKREKVQDINNVNDAPLWKAYTSYKEVDENISNANPVLSFEVSDEDDELKNREVL